MSVPDDKPELSSAELLRQAREAFGPSKRDTFVGTQVAGPTIQELLTAPLSSESLLPQRAVDYWAESEQASPMPEVQEPTAPALAEAAPPAPASPAPKARRVPKRRFGGTRDQPAGPPTPGQPPLPGPPPMMPPAVGMPASPTGSTRGAPQPAWLASVRDDLELPPAPPSRSGAVGGSPRPTGPNRSAPRPLGPPVQQRTSTGRRWLVVVAAFIGISAFVGLLSDGGTTSPAERAVLGGCYDSSNFERANSVDCAQLHRVQIFAQLEVNPAFDRAINSCFEASNSLRERGLPVAVPDNTFVGAIGTQGTGGGNTFCYFESPTGDLVGSVLRE